jgi:hypothetical protein
MRNKLKNKSNKQAAGNGDITQYNLDFVDNLIKWVKDMPEEEYKKLLKWMARFHQYSLSNQVILFSAGASQVAGFQKWIEEGRTVKRWSKAIWILAPMVSVKEKEDGTEDRKIWWFKSIPVFDIKDTEWEEVKRWLTKTSRVDLDVVLGAAERLGYTVGYEPLEISMGGYIREKSIVLNSNLSKSENIGTLIHELSHWELGHTTSMDLLPRSMKEQEAETTTAILCDILGIERNSHFYLKVWNLWEEIKASLNKIDKVVKGITDQLKLQESVCL